MLTKEERKNIDRIISANTYSLENNAPLEFGGDTETIFVGVSLRDIKWILDRYTESSEGEI